MPCMKVTLARALKIKNRQVRKVTELQRRIQEANSYVSGSEPEFDAKALYVELQTQVDLVASIKAAINEANTSIQADIYRMAELKGLVQFLRALSTQRGKVVLGYMSGDPVDYEAQITAQETSDEIERLEAEIDRIQDRLDQFNATTQIEIDVAE